MSSAEHVKMLSEMMVTPGSISPSFMKLVEGDTTSWKRINKFHYDEGVRRYFYLLKSALIATVDEREPTSEEVQDRNKMLEEIGGVSLEDTKKMLAAKMVRVMVRPPMLWEQFMLQDVRPDDKYIQEDLGELWEKYYEFCYCEAAKGSEAQQYTFEVGPDDGGWIFFSPIKCDHFDQHLTGDLDPIIPDWLLKGGEIMECTYAIDEHPLWRMGQLDDCLEAIQKEMIELGFVHSKIRNYAKCV